MKLFFSTFFLIFVSELPDKTALATLMLAACNHPLAVFLGAAGAYVVQSLFAVILGSGLNYIPSQWVHIGSGVIFLALAILMWFRKQDAEDVAVSGRRKSFGKVVSTSFVVIFLAEWGDLTQIGTATLVAKYGSPWIIFVAATLALWAASAVMIIIGHQAKHRINPVLLKRIAAVIFAGVGISILAGFQI